MCCVCDGMEWNSLLKMLQPYSWIENKFKTVVKRNTKNTNQEDQEKIQRIHKNTLKTH